LSNYFFKS